MWTRNISWYRKYVWVDAGVVLWKGQACGTGHFRQSLSGIHWFIKAKSKLNAREWALKEVLQDRRYKNRELGIMARLAHCNIVTMKEYFLKLVRDVVMQILRNVISVSLWSLSLPVSTLWSRSREKLKNLFIRKSENSLYFKCSKRFTTCSSPRFATETSSRLISWWTTILFKLKFAILVRPKFCRRRRAMWPTSVQGTIVLLNL